MMEQPAEALEPRNRVDPVCGMEVDSESPHRFTYKQIDYGFCSRSCLDKFRTRPDRFLKPVQDSDPVCGMAVTDQSEFQFHYDGFKYHFCSEHCRNKFAADPFHYLNPRQADRTTEHVHDESGHACHPEQTAKRDDEVPVAGALYTCPMHPEIQEERPGPCPKCGMALELAGEPAAETRTEYTCPMHPEIVQDHPGTCPKCGMALEPRSIAIEEKNEELIDMSRRFWVSAVLSLPPPPAPKAANKIPSPTAGDPTDRKA